MVIQLFLNLRQFLEVFITRIGDHQMRDIVITLEVNRLFCNPFGDKIVDATLHVARRILLQTRHNQILLINNTPIVKTLFTVQVLHQRRFARAITANQTDPLVIFDMQFSIIKKRRIAERQPCTMHTD